MKISSSILIIFLILTLTTCSIVQKLTDSNFHQIVSSNKYVMVKFYAPWCGHCKTMIPEYEKLAQLVKDNGIIIGELDATQQKKIATQMKIQGFPTIKLFIDGYPVEYKGSRTADQMYGWIKKVSQIKFQEINEEKIQQLRQKQNLIVYYGMDDQKLKILEHINIVDSSATYFKSSNANEQTDKLTLFITGSEQAKDYPQSLAFTQLQIKNWVMVQTVPTVVSLSKKQYLDWVFYDQSTMKDAFLFLQQSDTNEQVYQKYQKICENNKKKFKCSHADRQVEIYSGVKNYLKGNGKSVLALIKDGFKQAYTYKGDFNQITEQSILTFIQQVDNKKHQNIAAKQVQQKQQIHYQNVKELSDSTFDQFIKSNKIVLVEFFSQQCTHCVQFAQKYETFAKKAIDEKKEYILAAIDANKNKKVAKMAEVKSYPSFILYYNGQSIPYQGSRAESDIFGFLDSILNAKIISVGSIAQIPTPSVIISGPLTGSNLKILPSLFTRYPIYHLNQGNQLKITLKQQQQQHYPSTQPQSMYSISIWLNKLTQPILVNLLFANVERKLMQALQNKISLLCLVDIQNEQSLKLIRNLQEYCKKSQYVCGYAKKSQENFKQFTEWTGLGEVNQSKLVFIKTDTFERYLYDKDIKDMTKENIEKFVHDVKDKKIGKLNPEEEAREVIEEENKEQTKEQNKEQKQSQSSNDQQQQKQQKIIQSQL